jgi:hypothetical protein
LKEIGFEIPLAPLCQRGNRKKSRLRDSPPAYNLETRNDSYMKKEAL